MAFNLFGKKKEEKKDKPEEGSVSETKEVTVPSVAPTGISQGAHEVIKNFYVSEKASRLMGDNQYVFKVAKDANKPSIRKHISALYKVKVINVQVMNMPEKSRNVGKYTGKKSGFRKAIVTLAEGDTIEQAKP